VNWKTTSLEKCVIVLAPDWTLRLEHCGKRGGGVGIKHFVTDSSNFVIARTCNHCCRGEAVSNYVLRVFVCSLGYLAWVAHASCYQLCPVRLYKLYPRYLINVTIFEKLLLNIKCVFWFSLQFLSETFLILRRNEWAMIRNVYGYSCKVPFILVRCLWNPKFLDIFYKNIQLSHLMNILPVGFEVLHAGGQIDCKTWSY